MDRSPKPPEALTRAIAQDLRPVRPSPRPLYLALRMVPLALVVSSVILLAIGPRHDIRTALDMGRLRRAILDGDDQRCNDRRGVNHLPRQPPSWRAFVRGDPDEHDLYLSPY